MSEASPRTAVVTGATSGIGRWIALGLARAGWRVVLIARTAARGEMARAWITDQAPEAMVEVVPADLSLLNDTAAAARMIAERHPRLSLLVNNAGIFHTRREQTREGRELVLATNHLGPLILMRELEAALRAGAPSRIVTVGSSTSDRARIKPDDLELRRGWNMVRAYSQSKLAVMIATFTMAERLAGSNVDANVVHPGAVATGLVRAPGAIGLAWRLMRPWLRTEPDGADTPLFAALDEGLVGITGRYLKDRRTVAANPRAGDAALRQAVWQASERLIAATVPQVGFQADASAGPATSAR